MMVLSSRGLCLLSLAVLLEWGTLGAEARTIRDLAALVQAGDLHQVESALTSDSPFHKGEDQGITDGRGQLEADLLQAPPAFLKAFLAKGFDPNAVVIEGGAPADSGRTRFYRGTFFYRTLLSGRTELLSLLKIQAPSLAIRNASIEFQGPLLLHFLVETLPEAIHRIGDEDSLAFARAFPKVPAREPLGNPSLTPLVSGQVLYDDVGVRTGPGTTFAQVASLSNNGDRVEVLEAGPPRFLDQGPWFDRWFRIAADGKPLGWIWGGYLGLPFEHGEKLTGPLLVDFLLWKQQLYSDVWNRAQDSERWIHSSLYRWAIPLKDGKFLAFLASRKAKDFILLGEAGESLAQLLVEIGDSDGLAFWVENGYRFESDFSLASDHKAYAALQHFPEANLFRLFNRGAYPFEAPRTTADKNGGGDSWGSTTTAACELLPQAPVSALLELLPTWKDLNHLFLAWEASPAGYDSVKVWTLLDSALQRGNRRLIEALQSRGAQTRDAVLARSSLASLGIPQAKVNDGSVRLRRQPTISGSIVRLLSKAEPVFLLDQGPVERLSTDPAPGRWVYVMTEKKEFGWVWGAFLTSRLKE